MSDQPTQPGPTPGPETQKQRWMKYGSNVVLVSVVVVLLGFVAVAIAQSSRVKARIDTTAAGMYSLRPQTKSILRDLKQNVRIVSLYAQVKPPQGKEEDFVDYATPVADLLQEYKRHSGGKIEVDIIDPTQNPAKVDDLIEDVTKRYGGEVAQYSGLVTEYKDKHDSAIRKALAEEVTAAPRKEQLEADKSALASLVSRATSHINDVLIRDLDEYDRVRARRLAQKPPDYKGAVATIRSAMRAVSEEFAGPVAEEFKRLKGDESASQAVRDYVAAATPRYEAMKKQADELIQRIDNLGELKLDDLRQTLQARNSIVVLGPKDMRVLPFEQVWQDDPNVRRMIEQVGDGGEVPRRFAGEQQITSAILGLTQERRPKVAFVRGGGPPLAQPGGLFGRSGPLAQVAARLGDYNFDVVEKDLSGMWAMQAQMQRMPAAPEPSDEEIKDAIWVVIGMPQQGGGPMGPPPSIGPRVAEHLKSGGSAMVLMMPQAEDLSSALGDYGISIRTDAMVVHEPVRGREGAPGDMVNEAQKNPYIFIIAEYGKHMLAEPLRSLDMPLIAAVPVTITPTQGVTQWNLIPVPTELPAWGETRMEDIGEGQVSFDPASDVPGPLFAGAAAKKDAGEGRVVVLGTFESFTNQIVSFPDMELLRRRVLALRFPGSAELFTNSLLWLAKMEPMIAISPAAMDVSRIEPMSETGEWFWRNGVLLIGLPLLVLLAGGLMYIRRRD